MSGNTQIVESFWLARPSTTVAPDLLGCSLVRKFPDGETIRAMIVETEAYGPFDPACHAYARRTPRLVAMFGPAGRIYRTHLRSFKSPILGRMKHLDIKNLVFLSDFSLESFIPTPHER